VCICYVFGVIQIASYSIVVLLAVGISLLKCLYSVYVFCVYYLCYTHAECVTDMQNVSSEDFICALQRLGFDKLNKVTAQSFAWMFDYEPLWPFFDWFCTELQATNVLKLSELEW